MVSGVEQGGPASHLDASSMAPLREKLQEAAITHQTPVAQSYTSSMKR